MPPDMELAATAGQQCPGCRGAQVIGWNGALACPKCKEHFRRTPSRGDTLAGVSHEVLQIFETPTSSRTLVLWRRALVAGNLWLVGPPGWLFLVFVIVAGIGSFIGTFVIWIGFGGSMPVIAPIILAFLGASLTVAVGSWPFAKWWERDATRTALVREGLNLDGGRALCPPCMDIAIPLESTACPTCKRKKLIRPPAAG